MTVDSAQRSRLVFVVGPTACGKTNVAIDACERSAARTVEIINCDSVQFFAGVEIGAAKPTAAQKARACHHLLGHVPVGGEYTAGAFRRDALDVVEQGASRGVRRFFVVGGSGFYVQALEKGMFDVPEVPHVVREQLEAESVRPGAWQSLYTELSARDPETARKIDRNDRYRILRALEILRAHSGTLTEIRDSFRSKSATELPPFKIAKVGLFRPREELRSRVVERTRRMLADGLIEETTELRRRLRELAPGGALDAWAPLRSVGYKEVQDYLDQRLAKNDLENAIVTSTMQLAKRQMTWFKRDPQIRWFNAETEGDAAREYAAELLEP